MRRVGSFAGLDDRCAMDVASLLNTFESSRVGRVSLVRRDVGGCFGRRLTIFSCFEMLWVWDVIEVFERC